MVLATATQSADERASQEVFEAGLATRHTGAAYQVAASRGYIVRERRRRRFTIVKHGGGNVMVLGCVAASGVD